MLYLFLIITVLCENQITLIFHNNDSIQREFKNLKGVYVALKNVKNVLNRTLSYLITIIYIFFE